MLLGLDVGGTHTDVVLIDENGIAASKKVITRKDDLLASVNEGIEAVLEGVESSAIRRVNLSTTLSTNAIIEGKSERTGVIVTAGPGIEPDNFMIGGDYYRVRGALDHRGTEIKALDARGLETAVKELKKAGIKTAAAVGKFSTRNPLHENAITERLKSAMDFVAAGHTLSGRLNFPRRIVTAYYNAAVWRVYNGFAESVEQGMRRKGISAALNVLKADGGTMPLSMSRNLPVETILSGPAASVMGIIALCDIRGDSVILDIGGTTTDIAVFASGTPLIEPDGIDIAGRSTLVRALKTRSIGIGGDSAIVVKNGAVTAGPERRGPAMADGGTVPALIDAFNCIGADPHGDVEASKRGIAGLSAAHGLDAAVVARGAVDYGVARIVDEVNELLGERNARPVYTIHELLEGVTVQPRAVYCMGGPARAFLEELSAGMGMKVEVPANYAVANAIGAALARTTLYLEVLADTEKRRLMIPDIGVDLEIPSNYSLEEAERDAKKYLIEYMRGRNVEDKYIHADIVESSSFNMVQGFFTTGKNIRVKCQVKPGIIQEYQNVMRER